MNRTEGTGIATVGGAPVARRRRRAWSLAAAILIAGAGLTACGGSGGSAGASKSATPGSGGGAAKGSDSAAKAVQYAECMRKNGVPQFPDPVDGRVKITARKGSGLEPDSPQFKAAEQACKAFAPSGVAGGGRDNDRMLKFAQCMRKNGVPGFPDPEGGKLLLKPGQGVDPQSPQFKAAQKACQKELPAGAQDGPQ